MYLRTYAMKNISFCLILGLLYACTEKPEPNFSGKYKGIISGTDIFEKAPSADFQKQFTDTIEVTVIKNDIGYIVRGFDTMDIPIQLSIADNFSAPAYENVNAVNSVSGMFGDRTITIQGNWRYTYPPHAYTASSVTRRNYKYIGVRE